MKNKEYQRKWRQARIDAGLCCRCGKGRLVADRTHCQPCLSKMHKKTRSLYDEIKENKICWDCKVAKAHKHVRCDMCHAKMINDQAKKRKETREIIKEYNELQKTNI